MNNVKIKAKPKAKQPKRFASEGLNFVFITSSDDNTGDGYIWIGNEFGDYVSGVAKTKHLKELRDWCDQMLKERK